MKNKIIETESFATRWSRRKHETVSPNHAPEDSEIETVDKHPAPDSSSIEESAESKREALNKLTDEDMPDIDTLDENSDFSGFMSTSVSEALRKMALQKLFHGKSYNLRDGLDEYDGDYSHFEKLDKSVITCDMKHRLEIEAEKLMASEKSKNQTAPKIPQDNALIEEETGETLSLAEKEAEENKEAIFDNTITDNADKTIISNELDTTNEGDQKA